MADPDESYRLRQALAEFGIFALRNTELDPVLDEACRQAAQSLGIDMAKILEAEPDRGTLLIRSGYGLLPGTVGQARVDMGRGSAAGLAFETGEPVISNETETETRFEISQVVRRHGVRSMCNVVINTGDGEPFGVLELDSRQPGSFAKADIPYLQNYANLVGAAIGRGRSRQALQQALTERDILMRELQHRVKNDLQAVIGLLVVEASDADNPDTRLRLERVRGRVNALRLVHERLFRDERIGTVDARSYLDDLARNAIELWAAAQRQHVELTVSGDTVGISHDMAVTLGLVVNEFITNSLKHAFPFGEGRIALTLQCSIGRFRLVLADNGIGLPEHASRHSGRRFIEALAKQLEAEIAWSSEQGVQLSLRFELPDQTGPRQ